MDQQLLALRCGTVRDGNKHCEQRGHDGVFMDILLTSIDPQEGSNDRMSRAYIVGHWSSSTYSDGANAEPHIRRGLRVLAADDVAWGCLGRELEADNMWLSSRAVTPTATKLPTHLYLTRVLRPGVRSGSQS